MGFYTRRKIYCLVWKIVLGAVARGGVCGGGRILTTCELLESN